MVLHSCCCCIRWLLSGTQNVFNMYSTCSRFSHFISAQTGWMYQRSYVLVCCFFLHYHNSTWIVYHLPNYDQGLCLITIRANSWTKTKKKHLTACFTYDVENKFDSIRFRRILFYLSSFLFHEPKDVSSFVVHSMRHFFFTSSKWCLATVILVQ